MLQRFKRHVYIGVFGAARLEKHSQAESTRNLYANTILIAERQHLLGLRQRKTSFIQHHCWRQIQSAKRVASLYIDQEEHHFAGIRI